MTSVVKYVKPNAELLQYVEDNMREIDKLECREMSGNSPIDALNKGIELSQYATVVVIDNEPCAVVGLSIVSAVNGLGVPWLLATESAVRNKRVFVNNAKQGVDDMRTVCPNLVNYVHEDNKLSIRWLKWMGFTIEESQPLGFNGAMFRRFYIGDVSCVTQ